MVLTLALLGGSAAVGLYWWYQRRRPVHHNEATVQALDVPVNQGNWVVLDAQQEDANLVIVAAHWGDLDITDAMRTFCAHTNHIEFAATFDVLHYITDDQHLTLVPTEGNLSVAYY